MAKEDEYNEDEIQQQAGCCCLPIGGCCGSNCCCCNRQKIASNLNRDHPLKGSLKKRMVLFERCIRYSEEHILPHHERQRTVKFSDQQDVQPQKHEEEEAQQQPPLQHESRDAEKDEEETEEEEDDEYEGFEIDYDFPPEQLLSAE